MNAKVKRGIGAVILGLALASTAGNTQAASDMADRTAIRNVADFQDVPSMTGGIQEAVDSLPASGGAVVIPPGEYVLRCYVRLRDNVSLLGSGASTVLKKDDDFRVPLVEDARKGEKYVVVEDASGLAPGMGIMLLGGKNNFWWSCYRIAGIEGNSVFLECTYTGRNELAKDVLVGEKARLQHQFPMICISRSHNNLIRDMTIDGNSENQLPDSSGAGMGCGVFPMGNHCKVESCWIRNMLRDGITYNTTQFGVVCNCVIHDNSRDGIHLGGGPEAMITGNDIHSNANSGIYFCAGNWHCTISQNLIHHNRDGIAGIGPLEEGRHSIISNNIIYHNRIHGIAAYEAYGFIITGNIVRDNSQDSESGAGIYLRKARQTIVSNNHCFDHQDYSGGAKTQSCGIVLRGKSSESNVISGNVCTGNLLHGILWDGKDNQIHGNVGDVAKIGSE